jgi:hypothetical protein
VTKRNIMICADDYALSPAISRGILEAFAAGRLSATGAMTNRPSWRAAAKDLATFDGRADLGLHFNLTLGEPISAMPKFAPTGTFPLLPGVVRGAVTRALPLDEIGAEVARQLDAFEEAFGRPPDFVDGHQHVHVLPGVRRVLLDELKRRGLVGRLWLRDSSDTPASILARRLSMPKALRVKLLATGFARAATAAGFAVNEGFSGYSEFDPASDYGTDFANYLRAPGHHHLLMCHPGYVDDELTACDPVTVTRERELAFLLSNRFRETLDVAGVALARWNGSPIDAI